MEDRQTKGKQTEFPNIIQDVSKMLGQTSRVSFSHKNKEKGSYKHMSGNEWFFSLTGKLH
jgi:hypothetical protein